MEQPWTTQQQVQTQTKDSQGTAPLKKDWSGWINRRIGVVGGVYFGVMALGLLLRSNWRWQALMGMVLFLLGGVLGMVFGLADRLIFVYFSRPEDDLSVKVRGLIKQKRYQEGLNLLLERKHEQVQLAMNNVLFLGAWVVLALFLMTSSLSLLAQGLILGVGLNLVLGIKEDWSDKEYLMGKLFWPIKRKVSEDELKVVVGVFGGFFVLVSLMALFGM